MAYRDKTDAPSTDTFDPKWLDREAFVQGSGLIVAALDDRAALHQWLRAEFYHVDSLDFSTGVSAAIESFGATMNWEAKFGYELRGEQPNLDAIRDGFNFDAYAGGRVLELLRIDLAQREDADFVAGFLEIAAEHAREQAANGQRFFTVLVMPPEALRTWRPSVRIEVPLARKNWGSGSRKTSE